MADATATVATVMAEVLDRVRPADLAAALEQRGLAGPNGRYAVPTIYRWAAGRIMPSADVFLESARIAELSLDQPLYGATRRDELVERVENLERVLVALQEDLATVHESRGSAHRRGEQAS